MMTPMMMSVMRDDVDDHGEDFHGGHGCGGHEDVDGDDETGDEYDPKSSTTTAKAYGAPVVPGNGYREATDVGLRHRPT